MRETAREGRIKREKQGKVQDSKFNGRGLSVFVFLLVSMKSRVMK